MSKQRIFNSAQEIEGVFGVKVVLRDNLPKNCNVVMYQLGDKPEIRPVDYFVENENGLFYITYNGKMEVQNDSLEDEVAWDYENLGHKTFIYLRLATKDKLDKRIFDSIEDINKTFGVDLELPKKVPEGADIICYNIVDLYRVELFMYFKETLHELLGYTGGKWDHSGSVSIEEEIKWDSESSSNSYIYLRLAQKHIKHKFTPERLLGVETTEGFINKLNQNIKGFINIGYTTCDPRELQYYISDDSDETVSFDEYLKLFYDAEGVL